MDFLGNISVRLVGLVATILTLGAAYLFIVKPVTDTTNTAFKQIGEPISRSLDISQRQLNQSVRQARRQDREAIRISGEGQVGLRQAQRLLGCVQRANGDVDRMNACAQRLGP